MITLVLACDGCPSGAQERLLIHRGGGPGPDRRFDEVATGRGWEMAGSLVFCPQCRTARRHDIDREHERVAQGWAR